MFNFNKMLASVLIALSSSTAIAENIIIPHEYNAWKFGASALYLHPSFAGNGLGYSSYSSYAGADNSGIIKSTNGVNQINNVNPKWEAGFALAGNYYFGAGNDINLSWYHLNEHVDGHLPPTSLFSGSVD